MRSRAPDCSTVYVVPTRNGGGVLVQAGAAAHISAAMTFRSALMRRLLSTSSLYAVALRLSCVLALPPSIAAAQGLQLTVENIMRGPDLVGTAPSNVRFSADGRYVYFRWRSPGAGGAGAGVGADTTDQDYRAAVSGGSPERLPRSAVDTIAMADGAWSPDRTREVVVLKGDLWLVDRRGAERGPPQKAGGGSQPRGAGGGPPAVFTAGGQAGGGEAGGGRARQA